MKPIKTSQRTVTVTPGNWTPHVTVRLDRMVNPGDYNLYSLTPKHARRLAKALKRVAREIEAR